ncbi:hypothetical protein QLX67_13600, partial [Balneolaceae bacterium ANBcel3]|nr:hypothetical protein [Balneolaceae bacterium ANBcel3]
SHMYPVSKHTTTRSDSKAVKPASTVCGLKKPGKGVRLFCATILFLLVSGLIPMHQAHSQASTVWNGSVSNDWLDSANWSNGVPDENTNAEIQWFPASNPDPVITGNTEFRQLRINNFGRPVQVTVADGVEVEMDNLIVGATGSPGQIAFNAANGHVTVNNTTNITGAIFLDAGSITFLDDFTMSSSALFTVQTGTVNVGDPGPPVISADFSILNSSVFNLNNGTLNIYGSSEFDNSGTFNAGSGDIVLDGDITLSGNTAFNPQTSTVSIVGNSTITVNNNIDGNTISFYDLNISGDAQVVSNSNVLVNNDMVVDETASYQQTDGTTLNVVGTVTGDPEISTNRPYIISIIINSPTSISAVFDEPLNPATAVNPANYRIENPSGTTIDNPTNFSLGGPMDNIVTMDLGFSLVQDEVYYLVVNNVQNLSGFTVSPNHRKRIQDTSPPVFYSRQSGDWSQANNWSVVSHTGPAA